MSKKVEFINYIEQLITNVNEMPEGARTYWEAFKEDKVAKEKSPFTENGKIILNYMKTSDNETPLKAKDIAEAIGLSARSVSGSMRSLVSSGYIESLDTEPKKYLITEMGKNIIID